VCLYSYHMGRVMSGRTSKTSTPAGSRRGSSSEFPQSTSTLASLFFNLLFPQTTQNKYPSNIIVFGTDQGRMGWIDPVHRIPVYWDQCVKGPVLRVMASSSGNQLIWISRNGNILLMDSNDVHSLWVPAPIHDCCVGQSEMFVACGSGIYLYSFILSINLQLI
jgi:hypothetical protein